MKIVAFTKELMTVNHFTLFKQAKCLKQIYKEHIKATAKQSHSNTYYAALN